MLNKLKKMNGYYEIMLIALTITIISVFVEYKYGPLYPLKSDITSNIKRLFWRWLHWCIILFNCLFFLFFNVKTINNNIILYYSLMIATVLHWYTRICMISLLETKNYDVNIEEITTSNLPHITSILGDKARICANTFYFIGIFNFIYITFYTKKLNSLFKYTFFILFAISFILNNILFRMKGKKEYYGSGFLYDCLMANPFV